MTGSLLLVAAVFSVCPLAIDRDVLAGFLPLAPASPDDPVSV